MASKKLLFISEAKEKEDKITISARIPRELHEEFERAKAVVKANGKELRITDICEAALRLAIEEVNKTYS